MTTTTTAQPAPARLAWIPLTWIGTLHLLALLAFVPAYFSWSGVAVCIFLHWLTGGIGICLGYHRLLTHRSFALRPRWLEYFFTILGNCASEGGAIGWIADHRKHHAHSDEEDDTHTPLRGFLWAHMCWWMKVEEDSEHSLAVLPEVVSRPLQGPCSPLAREVPHHFPDHAFRRVCICVGGMSWLVWGGFVRTVLVLHSTWLVNSASHVWGYRSHVTRDRSTNLWWVALLTYGEGWHNNHHAYQTSARHGLRWWEIDMTYLSIQFMKLCRVAYDIRLPKIRSAVTPPAVASAASN